MEEGSLDIFGAIVVVWQIQAVVLMYEHAVRIAGLLLWFMLSIDVFLFLDVLRGVGRNHQSFMSFMQLQQQEDITTSES